MQFVVVLHGPAGRGITRREEAAHAALGEQLDPAVPRRRDVHERGHPGQQQLAIGELGAVGAGIDIGCLHGLRTLVKPGHVHPGQSVLFADAAVERFVMRV